MSKETRKSLSTYQNNKSRYLTKYQITDDDVNMVNKLIKIIETSRSELRPVPGDIIICKGPEKEYKKGHLDKPIDEDHYSNICVEPYIPFISKYNQLGHIPTFSTSGGYWLTEDAIEMFTYVGKDMKFFCEFGHNGACSDGAIYFHAEVNVWELFREDIY